jgi:hypothetical protein
LEGSSKIECFQKKKRANWKDLEGSSPKASMAFKIYCFSKEKRAIWKDLEGSEKGQSKRIQDETKKSQKMLMIITQRNGIHIFDVVRIKIENCKKKQYG